MKTFLHVGCGHKRKNQTTKGFNTAGWTELRLIALPARIDDNDVTADNVEELTWRR
jgi:hypothetical protein